MRRLPIGLMLLSAAGMLGAAALAETKVEVKDVHLCCPACVKGVGKALKDVEGVKGACDKKAGTVTLTATDVATAQKGIEALAAAGFHGKLGNQGGEVPARQRCDLDQGQGQEPDTDRCPQLLRGLQHGHQESRQEGRRRHRRYRQAQVRDLRGHRGLRGPWIWFAPCMKPDFT